MVKIIGFFSCFDYFIKMLDMKIETFIAYQKKKKKSRDWHLPVGRPLYIVYHETKQMRGSSAVW